MLMCNDTCEKYFSASLNVEYYVLPIFAFSCLIRAIRITVESFILLFDFNCQTLNSFVNEPELEGTGKIFFTF